jgi:hypothetical protein
MISQATLQTQRSTDVAYTNQADKNGGFVLPKTVATPTKAPTLVAQNVDIRRLWLAPDDLPKTNLRISEKEYREAVKVEMNRTSPGKPLPKLWSFQDVGYRLQVIYNETKDPKMKAAIEKLNEDIKIWRKSGNEFFGYVQSAGLDYQMALANHTAANLGRLDGFADDPGNLVYNPLSGTVSGQANSSLEYLAAIETNRAASVVDRTKARWMRLSQIFSANYAADEQKFLKDIKKRLEPVFLK